MVEAAVGWVAQSSIPFVSQSLADLAITYTIPSASILDGIGHLVMLPAQEQHTVTTFEYNKSICSPSSIFGRKSPGYCSRH